MYRPLVPCPSCLRHVRTTEGVCPFCAAMLSSDWQGRASFGVSTRMSRSALAALGAALTLSACSSTVASMSDAATSGEASTADTSPSVDTPSGPDGQTPDVARDTVPIPDVRHDTGPDDNGNPMPEYGAPPPLDAGESKPRDAGSTGDGHANDRRDGATPPPADAGSDASTDGAVAEDFPVVPLYGAPPLDTV